MKLQNPSKLNPVQPDSQFQQEGKGSKGYFAMKRLLLVPDLGNTQETRRNTTRRKPTRLNKNKTKSRTLPKVFLDPHLTGKDVTCGCHTNYPRCKFKIITYILELGQ